MTPYFHFQRSYRYWPRAYSYFARELSHIGYNFNEKRDQHDNHWLDKYFPSVRPWLQKQSRNWWIYGVKSRCNDVHGLQSQKERIQLYLEKAYYTYFQKYSSLAVDGPSHTHLQMACLVLATYKVVHPWVRDPKIVIDLINSQMGASGAPLLRGLLHSMLFLRNYMFGTNSFLVLSGMMKSLKFDMGAAWDSALIQKENETTLEITRCLYYDIFSSEGVPNLSSACCCSQDKTWFDGMEFHKVAYKQDHWLGKGDSTCCLNLSKIN